LAHTLASVHSVNRRKAVTPDKPKPGGSWFQVQPEAATKMIAASTSRSLVDDAHRSAGEPAPVAPPLEQGPQIVRRHPLDKRSSHHPRLPQGHAK
jgi:hypothetical protein